MRPINSRIRLSESAPTRFPADSNAMAVTVQHTAVSRAAISPRYCCTGFHFKEANIRYSYRKASTGFLRAVFLVCPRVIRVKESRLIVLNKFLRVKVFWLLVLQLFR